MEIVSPRYLLFAPIALLAIGALFALFGRSRRRAMARFVSPFQVERLVKGERRRRRFARAALAALGAALVIASLSRPRWGTKLEVVTRRGVDVIAVLDTSLSMMTEDVKPNRLELAKRQITDLVDRLQGDRIGIVTFAGASFISCPLTLDHGAAKMFLADVGPYTIPEPGTAIGDAIRKAVHAFGRREQKYKVILLLTDGEDTVTNPLEAAGEAKEAGVVVYAVGFGTGAGAPIPVKEGNAVAEYKKDASGSIVVSKLDEATLASIAAKTGGAYYRATGTEVELDKILDAIGKMEKAELSQKLFALREERFQVPLVAGLVLLLCEAFLRTFRVSRRTKGRVVVAPAVAAAAMVLAIGVTAEAGGVPLTGAASDVDKGNDLYAAGKLDDAMAAYVKAKGRKPEAPEITYDVGNVLYRQKKYDEATAEYGRAATGSPAAVAARSHYNRGTALASARKLPEAIEAFKQAMRLDPKDEDAKWNYEVVKRQLEEQQKKHDEQQKQDQKDQKDEKGGQKDQQKEGQGEQRDKDKTSRDEESEQKDGQKKDEGQQEKKDQEQKPQGSKEDGERGKQDSRQEGGTGQPEQQNDGEPQDGQQLSPEQAEKVLDAFLQSERDARAKAEKAKWKKAHKVDAKDW